MSKPNITDLVQKAQEHTSPCGKRECIDTECQVEIMGLDRVYTLIDQGSWDQPKAAAFWSHFRTGLHRFLNDSQYGSEGPDFMFEASWEFAEATLREQGVTSHPVEPTMHVQAEKPVLEAPAKAVRKPRKAKHQPRITDGQEHPVVVTQKKEQPVSTSDLTLTPELIEDSLKRTISSMVERMVQERIDSLLQAKFEKELQAEVQEVMPNEPREAAGVVLPSFGVVGGKEPITVPALDLGDVTLDSVVSAKERSPYNKARFRLDSAPVALDKDTTTYRVLAAEHARLAVLAANKIGLAVEIKAEAKAKHDPKHVAAVMKVKGCDEAAAVAILDAVKA